MTKRVVVPFERPAAYWKAHARRHDTPDKRPAAARMLRKALEKNGDPATAVELARIYVSMECTTAAERCLIRAVSRGGLTGDVCYLIGCCALNRGEENIAETAFETCQRLDPDGECADLAQDALEMYPWEMGREGSWRCENWCRRAREALAAGQADQARQWARRAWKMERSPQAALLMGAFCAPRQAIPYFAHAARLMPGDLKSRLLLAMACQQAGREQEALLHLRLARALCSNLTRTEDFCAAAWEMNRPEEALEVVNQQLERAPASVDYLRAKYLCLRRLRDDAAARRALETLLDIDPDDASGLRYRRHPEDMQFHDGRFLLLSVLGFQVRSVPQRLRPGRLNRLLHGLTMALRDDVDAESVYRLVPPLWRKMSETERNACDRGNSHYSLALALYVLTMSGKGGRARALYQAAPGKKRLRRTMRRLTQRKMRSE